MQVVSPVHRKSATVLAWLLAAVTLLAVACGGSDSDTPEAPSPSPSPTGTPTPRPTATPTPEPPPEGILDGVLMSPAEFEARAGQAPVAVMMDNHPNAYPHSGLDKADLVFEAFVEGQITRYMAVFWRQDTDYIEPVRSARTPFVMWAAELQALYAHVGSSTYPGEADAPAHMVEWGVPSLDGDMLLTPTFYRDQTRYAPHNVVTGTGAIRGRAAELGIDPGTGISGVESWLFQEDGEGTAAYPASGGVDVSFSSRQVTGTVVGWTWDAEINAYRRIYEGEAHVDRQTGEQLVFKNIVVMTVNPRQASPHGHIVLDQIGEGPAAVYLDGKRIDGTWRKPSVEERTRFYDASGKEIAFNRGSTWIEVVAPTSAVSER